MENLLTLERDLACCPLGRSRGQAGGQAAGSSTGWGRARGHARPSLTHGSCLAARRPPQQPVAFFPGGPLSTCKASFSLIPAPGSSRKHRAALRVPPSAVPLPVGHRSKPPPLPQPSDPHQQARPPHS